MNRTWYYNNKELKVVNSFVYLGVLLHYNGRFQQTQKRLAEQGGRALASLFCTLKSICISKSQQCSMFDSLVASILNYASEIWGFHQGKDIEVIHNKFCRFVLNVPKNTPVCGVIGELGHLPMYIIRKQRLLKYWVNIVTNKPNLVFNIYQLLLNDCNNGKENWATNVRKLLYDLGLNYVWDEQNNIMINYNVLKVRLLDQFYQNWRSSIENSEKLSIYKVIKSDFKMEEYLLKDFSVQFLTLIRLGVLKLNIETGRYVNQPRNNRVCLCCNLKNIENEYHFLLVCPAYRQYRIKYLPRYYHSWPHIHKLYTLLQATNSVLLKNVICYIRECWKIRTFITNGR